LRRQSDKRVLLSDFVQGMQRRCRAAAVNLKRERRRDPRRSIGIAAAVDFQARVLSPRQCAMLDANPF
jgi:hypothetical protein